MITSTRDGGGVFVSDDIVVLIGGCLCLIELCRLSGQNRVQSTWHQDSPNSAPGAETALVLGLRVRRALRWAAFSCARHCRRLHHGSAIRSTPPVRRSHNIHPRLHRGAGSSQVTLVYTALTEALRAPCKVEHHPQWIDQFPTAPSNVVCLLKEVRFQCGTMLLRQLS